MTLYYNPAYSSSPYRKAASDVEFGNIYCGDVQLLQRLLFYAGVSYRPVANEERIAHYHANIQQKITTYSPFYESFKTDSAGMSRSVLAWRDALVEVGWDVKSYLLISSVRSINLVYSGESRLNSAVSSSARFLMVANYASRRSSWRSIFAISFAFFGLHNSSGFYPFIVAQT